MRANSRSSIRWGVATAVVALALGALAITGKAALADGGGNGRLMAANHRTLPDDAMSGEKVQPASDSRRRGEGDRDQPGPRRLR
jgi:heme A synthase